MYEPQIRQASYTDVEFPSSSFSFKAILSYRLGVFLKFFGPSMSRLE